MRRTLDFADSVGPYGIDIAGPGVNFVTYEVRFVTHVKSLRGGQLLLTTQSTLRDKPWRSGPVNICSCDSSDTHIVANLLYQVG